MHAKGDTNYGERRQGHALVAWQILMSATLETQGRYTWWGGGLGSAGGLPISADYDGDGLADPAVYHQDTGLWELFPTT